MAASSPLLPFRARSYVIFATGDNTAWALDALAGSNGAPLWQVNDLPILPAAPALVTNTSAWWAGAPSSFGSGWLGVWRMDDVPDHVVNDANIQAAASGGWY